MNESDLLLVFGASFANHTGIASYKPIVQVDAEPDALGRFHPGHRPGARRHRGDRAAPRDASSLRSARGATPSTSAPTSPPAGRSGRPRRRGASTDDRGSRRRVGRAVRRARRAHVPADAVIAVDVGNNTYSFVAGRVRPHDEVVLRDVLELAGVGQLDPLQHLGDELLGSLTNFFTSHSSVDRCFGNSCAGRCWSVPAGPTGGDLLGHDRDGGRAGVDGADAPLAGATAVRGASARVETEVATALAVSWNPFVKSKISATITTVTSSTLTSP